MTQPTLFTCKQCGDCHFYTPDAAVKYVGDCPFRRDRRVLMLERQCLEHYEAKQPSKEAVPA